MPTTAGHSRGRRGGHLGAHKAVGDHMRKVTATLATATVIVVLMLAATPAGHNVDAATQRFMLDYAGVLALVGLTGSVLLGLVAADRIVITPDHRVMAQAVHRAFSFGALAFLVIHIVTEILAQRSHVIDAVVPFLSPYRTFYIGLGTIASDLIVLIVVTSVLRKRFTAHGKAWRWRAIHYTSYVAFVFGVSHGLLGGRTPKPYVDWSYGFAVAVTALALAVRFVAISLQPRERVASIRSPRQARLGRLSVTCLTDLAVLLAGSSRPALRDEWFAHLAGESGHDPITWNKAKLAFGFVASGVRLRLADAADLAWRPADAVLGSRTLSNLFVWGPVIVTLFAIVHHDGRFGLVADDQDPVALGAFLYVVIKTGRWWRGVKPPEPKARRAKE